MQIPESIRNSVEAARLPCLPQVLLRFLDVVEDDQVPSAELATLVGQDPGLSARFLAAANSPALRRDRQVASLADCITTLGTRLARTMAQCLLIESGFAGAGRETDHDLGRIWTHALRVAELSRALAIRTNYGDSEEAYLAGLLHDIGQLLLLGGDAEHYRDWVQNIGLEAKLRDIEELLYHTDHAAIGAWLVDQWQLSSFLSDAILFHHKHHDEIVDADPLSKIVWSCHVIDTSREHLDISSNQQAPELSTVISMFGLEPAEITRLGQEASEKVALLTHHLGFSEVAREDSGEQRARRPEQGAHQLEVEVRVRDLAIMQSLQRNLPELSREEEILLVMRESARILFGIGRLAFFFMEPTRPVLSAPAFTGQPELLRQLEIRVDGGRSLAAAAVRDKSPRSTLQKEPAAPLSLLDVQIARALESEGVLYIPMCVGGGQTGVMAYGITPSQHARLQKQLARMTRFANQAATSIESWRAQRAKEEMIAASVSNRFHQHARKVVHEAGNPLSIIKTYLAILSQKLPVGDAGGEELAILGEEVDRVGHILSRLGELSETPPATESVDINGMINGMLALYGETLFSSRGIVLEQQLSPSLLPVAGNRDSIKQVLLNLWTNAADALASGDHFVVSTADNVILNGRFYVEIALRDSGPGLPPEVMQRLFQPLDDRQRPGHSGLGLSIVASLVEGLNGLIKCQSEVGTGTSFIILLPRQMEGKALSRNL
ncbi:HDOD domain-containing protein [Geomonas sp.]|uniref:HDOD domain-containing protein n=1 Tax=Geomonas sp. TaxID=2651584 RepID=UPI002B4A1798|nr:HDOD domain-containing protein [Geomonas sp.]HJV35789.1 HDOD domain-containing protein [Geomonas sp.]